MSTDEVSAFGENWAYLKVELNWLDRILRLAVARQRQEAKEVDRVAKSKADRATAHWWKGLIYLEGKGGHEDGTPTSTAIPAPPQGNYQQQLEAKIQASVQQGVILGLPALRDRLALTMFAKNLLLMGLAPEINRRYAKLYSYLQEDECATLPSVDLGLRLLCRGDAEWQAARSQLIPTAPLVKLGLIEWVGDRQTTFLNRRFKLADRLVDFLLAETPNLQALEGLIRENSPPILFTEISPQKTLKDLVLPASLIQSLEQLSDTGKCQNPDAISPAGRLVLFVGAKGTGKTSSAEAIASSLQQGLIQIDLAVIDPKDYPVLLTELATDPPKILLIQSAQFWLGRKGLLTPVQLNQFWQQRQRFQGLTLFCVEGRQQVKPSLMQRCHRVLEFPIPQVSDRLRLWRQAFPSTLSLDPQIPWEQLAKRWKLTGGEIEAIARQAVCNAELIQTSTLTGEHLIQSWQQITRKT